MTYRKLSLRNLTRRRSRTFFTITAIGISVSLMILLMSVSLGMKDSKIQAESIDFWVVPAGTDVMDLVTGSQQTMLGGVHSEIDVLLRDQNVIGASPVMNKILYASPDRNGKVSVVLAIGVMSGTLDVMPFNTRGFTRGDPYFYGNNWTGETVINKEAARLFGKQAGELVYLNASAGGLAGSAPFRIVSIIDTLEYSGYPAVLLHLSELQYMTGNLKEDRADQIVVKGPDAEPLLLQLYPDHLILSGPDYTAHRIVSDKRMLATAAAASLVAFILAVLFIGTTMVMSVSEREREIALMSAIGISKYSIIKISFYESLFLSAAGGVVGVLMAVAGTPVLNFMLLFIFGADGIAQIDPVLLLGGFVIALGSGIITGVLVAVFMKRPEITSAF